MKKLLWFHGSMMLFGKMATPAIWLIYILWLISGGTLFTDYMPWAIITHLGLFISGYNW